MKICPVCKTEHEQLTETTESGVEVCCEACRGYQEHYESTLNESDADDVITETQLID